LLEPAFDKVHLLICVFVDNNQQINVMQKACQ